MKTPPNAVHPMKTSPLKVAPASALPRGFRFAAVNCGLRKPPSLDLGIILADKPVAAAGVFTQNLVQAAPVLLSREHLRKAAPRMRAVIVNSRNANCATGPAGEAAAAATAREVAQAVGCDIEQVLVCSTGVIGLPMRVERIIAAVPGLVPAATSTAEAFEGFTRAIMTTDTRPKWAASRCRLGGRAVRLLGCCKGAGMIHPQMATMLAYVVTDAAIRPSVLQRALATAVRTTFNSITVDGDTSTNDTLLVLASGEAGNRPITSAAGSGNGSGAGRDYRAFASALEHVCHSLALQIVSDGEGASHVIEIEVRGATSDGAAEQVARTIAGSPLVKTMFAGADPNWGRVLAAAGRAGVKFDPHKTDVYLGGILTCRGGIEHPFGEAEAHNRLLQDFVPVVVDLGGGPGKARVWTCDFTTDYVHINASYRT
jgi:glutamate N-acetyltransferase/amino-acid N-acetyltransferase